MLEDHSADDLQENNGLVTDSGWSYCTMINPYEFKWRNALYSKTFKMKRDTINVSHHQTKSIMTRAHLSPYRDATKQVADKLQHFCSASPGTLPSVCAYTPVSLCYKTKNWRDTLYCNQFLDVHKQLKVRQKQEQETFTGLAWNPAFVSLVVTQCSDDSPGVFS